MSPKEEMPKKSPERKTNIEINRKTDNFHIIAIKTLMQETGMNYFDAGEIYKAQVSGLSGSSLDLLNKIDDAVESVKLEIEKKTKSN